MGGKFSCQNNSAEEMKYAILGYSFIGAVYAATIKKVKGAELVAAIEKDKSK